MNRQEVEQATEREGVQNELAYLERILDPNEKYDRKVFIKKFDALKDATQYLENFQKDPTNPSNLTDVGAFLSGDFKKYLHSPPQKARFDLERAFEDMSTGLAGFVRGKLDTFLGKMDDKSLESYVASGPIFRTGGDKRGADEEHNYVFDIRQQRASMEKVMDDKDIGEMQKFLDAKIKSMDLPEGAKTILLVDMSTEPEAINRFYQREYFKVAKKLKLAVSTKEGKVDVAKIRGMIRRSISEIEYELGEETDDGDKSDLVKASLKPMMYELAKYVHKIEKAERNKGISGKVESKERAGRRSAKGMPL